MGNFHGYTFQLLGDPFHQNVLGGAKAILGKVSDGVERGMWPGWGGVCTCNYLYICTVYGINYEAIDIDMNFNNKPVQMILL